MENVWCDKHDCAFNAKLWPSGGYGCLRKDIDLKYDEVEGGFDCLAFTEKPDDAKNKNVDMKKEVPNW